MTLAEQVKTVDAFVRFIYNAECNEYPEGYLRDTLSEIRKNPVRAWGQLDPDNRRKLIEIAWERWLDTTGQTYQELAGEPLSAIFG